MLYLYSNQTRGLVKWYNRSLQNFSWEFDSLIPCQVNDTPNYWIFYKSSEGKGDFYESKYY